MKINRQCASACLFFGILFCSELIIDCKLVAVEENRKALRAEDRHTTTTKNNYLLSKNNSTATSCACSRKVEPVCGFDGTIFYTYINQCILECNAESRPTLKLEYAGFCCEYSNCQSWGQPVCDKNGELHQNLCFFNFYKCVMKKKYGVEIDLSDNTTNCHCQRSCPTYFDPVCDNKQMTHHNLCHFTIAHCVAKSRYNVDLTVDYSGHCCSTLCRSIPQPVFPVCDNRGKQHDNYCEFYIAQCKSMLKFNYLLTIDKYGSC